MTERDRERVDQIVAEFQVPSRPTPRERYRARSAPSIGGRGVHVEVLDGDEVVAIYDRNYDMLQTFEPFRQGERAFALISPNYTATSVLDLQTGEIIAGEEPEDDGFCPVGFYVPDWWDVHDGTTLPGSAPWRPMDHEWPSAGDLGFVWGCHWGHDSFRKVEYLDLTRIQDDAIGRSARFGYVELATDPKLAPQDFIRCSSWNGRRRVQFYVEQRHDADRGNVIDNDDW